MLSELGMPSIPSVLAFPHVTKLVDERGALLDPGFQSRAEKFFAEFEWYARAMRAQRAGGTPY